MQPSLSPKASLKAAVSRLSRCRSARRGPYRYRRREPFGASISGAVSHVGSPKTCVSDSSPSTRSTGRPRRFRLCTVSAGGRGGGPDQPRQPASAPTRRRATTRSHASRPRRHLIHLRRRVSPPVEGGQRGSTGLRSVPHPLSQSVFVSAIVIQKPTGSGEAWVRSGGWSAKRPTGRDLRKFRRARLAGGCTGKVPRQRPVHAPLSRLSRVRL